MDNFTERARRMDPISSVVAARQIEQDGTVEAQMRQVLAAVKAHPGHSSLAIAERAGLDRYMVARRLPELGRKKLVVRGPLQRCWSSDRLALTWLPSTAKDEQT